MLIVEGRSQKSLKIKDMIDNKNCMTLLINTTSCKLNFIDNKKVRFLEESKDQIFKMIKCKSLQKEIETFPLKINMIIFYINGDEIDLQIIREFEKEVGILCIATIQNNDMGNIKIYNM